MKRITRCLVLLLAAAMLLGTLPGQVFAAEPQKGAGGTIACTLRFDCPQLVEAVYSRDITFTLIQGEHELGRLVLTETPAEQMGEYPAAVTVKNRQGTPVTTEAEMGYAELLISNLPQGSYTLSLTGRGYKSYTTPELKLDTYSRQVVLGTGDDTFTIGDVNSDGTVDGQDLKLLSDALGNTEAEAVKDYDLNGDGNIDIIDLAYVNHQIGAEGDAFVYETALIAQGVVDTNQIAESVIVEGDVSSLFTSASVPVTVKPKDASSAIAIPLEFSGPVEMEQVSITTPSAAGTIQAGQAEIIYGDGSTEVIPFDTNPPEEGIYAIGREAGKNVVVIDLGKRVAVKKITITVTKTESETGVPSFAVIEEIRFLKDIVPENPALDNVIVKNIKAVAGSESVELSWSELPNVTGYCIHYGTQKGSYEKEQYIDVNRASITGLKNLTTYYFSITAVSGDWQGGYSDVVSAVPMPKAAPPAPDFVDVKPLDSGLTISWHKTKDATYYKVYYKEDGAENFVELEKQTAELSASIGGLENGKKYLLYVVAGNAVGESRPSAEVTGTPEKAEVEGPKLPTLNRMDNSNIESIVMTNKNNVAAGDYPNGFSVWNIADGNFGTHWSARVWWESHEFTFTLKEATEMNYMVYVPRLDGNYPKSNQWYTIKVWDEAGNMKVAANHQAIQKSADPSQFGILPFERSMVKKIAVDVMQWDGSPTNVSCSEVGFYQYDGLADRIRELFADGSYTALSPAALEDRAASRQNIETLTAQVSDAEGYYVDKDILLDELALAAALLEDDTSKLGVIKADVQSRNGAADSAEYGQSGSVLQPLGAAALAGSKIAVYADIPDGETVSVVPTQYYAEASAWQGRPVTLVNGRNEIAVPKIGSQNTQRGGALYLTYAGAKADQIKLQVRGAVEMPVLELSDWYGISEQERSERISAYVSELSAYVPTLSGKKLSEAALNVTELSLPNVLLSLPADQVLAGIKPTGADVEQMRSTLYHNVLAWEDVAHITLTTQGIDSTYENCGMQSRQNIRYMRMFAGAFMYAAGSHVGIGYGSCAALTRGKPVSQMQEGAKANNLFGWGIAHEIGHNMDKLGKAEITNNIYSLMVQTYDGAQNTLTSRLEGGKYKDIFDKVAQGRPGAANDVFVQLGMYWQLHLAYDGADSPMDFYNRFFKEWKAGTASGKPYDDRVALVASKTANRNLTDFFVRWGAQLSDETREELNAYSAEERAIWYLDDEARRYRLGGGTAASGETTASAVLDSENEKQVNLTFSSTCDANQIQGYEILRNGKPVAFVTGAGNYSDLIGTANQMAFQYTVQAVDKLGNATGSPADAGEIRIAYDKTIPAEQYTLTRGEDGTTEAVLNECTAVSGIKVLGAPETGAYRVEVKRDAESGFVTAKEGDFASGEDTSGVWLSYFNKPGADSADTRIWTYDASEIRVTGLPEDAEVQFISYAGDTVAFSDDAAVARLSEDYRYGDGEDELIPAGTMVITGTYRGNPIYNTLEIKGKFAVVNSETGEETMTERPISGDALMFAEVPEDGEVSDISDGFYLFIPNIQQEAELQDKTGQCAAESLLPVQIKAELYRTDTPDSADSKRLTSDTIWISSPGDDSIPELLLK